MNFLKRLVLLAAVVTTAAACGFPSLPTELPEGRVFASYYSLQIDLEEIKYEYYTHLISIGMKPDRTESGAYEFEQKPYAKDFAAACIANDVVPMYSLVNNVLEVNNEKVMVYLQIAREDRMDEFTDFLIESMLEHGFQGIDVDWEMPWTDEEITEWNRMMRQIRKKMNALEAETGVHYYLTTALPEWGMDICDPLTAASALDFINVMTYDYCGPWGMGHKLAANTSPFVADPRDPDAKSIPASIQKWLDAGFPKEKLILGLSYYGYRFTGYEPFEEMEWDENGDIPADKDWDWIYWKDVVALANAENEAERWESHFDEVTMASWFTSPDGNEFVYSDNSTIVTAKSEWAKEQGLGGLFSWCLGLDELEDKSMPLQDAAYAAWPAENNRR